MEKLSTTLLEIPPSIRALAISHWTQRCPSMHVCAAETYWCVTAPRIQTPTVTTELCTRLRHAKSPYQHLDHRRPGGFAIEMRSRYSNTWGTTAQCSREQDSDFPCEWPKERREEAIAMMFAYNLRVVLTMRNAARVQQESAGSLM